MKRDCDPLLLNHFKQGFANEPTTIMKMTTTPTKSAVWIGLSFAFVALPVTEVSAAFHLWQLTQIYSNADGTVQYIEMFNPSNNEQFVSGRDIDVSHDGGQDAKSFTFPSNLPSGQTGGRYVLIATGTIAGVEPDYIIPANFIPIVFDQNATVSLSFSGSSLTYSAIPTNGHSSLQANGTERTPATVTNFSGETATLPITPSPLAISLSDLTQTYTGQGIAVTVVTDPPDIPVTVHYNDQTSLPIIVGTYSVNAESAHPDYVGTAEGELVIEPAQAEVMLSNLEQSYDGLPKGVDVATSPPGLSVDVRYDGQSNPPSEIGEYTVTAVVEDPNYSGEATGTLTVTRGAAEVILSDLSAVYDGTAKPATASTDPEGLTVNITYDGSATPPVDAGSYAVEAVVIDTHYDGTASGTLVIAPASVSFAISDLSQTYTGEARSVGISSDPPGIGFAVTYDGFEVAPINAGSYAVFVQSTDLNYAGSAAGTLVVEKASVEIEVTDLEHVYDGTAKVASVTLDPGVAHSVTYNGSLSPPINAGDYTVHVVVSDPNFQGEASATLQIDRAPATVELTGNNHVTYDGSPKFLTATTSPEELAVAITYNGSPEAPSNAGSYTVEATISDSNFVGFNSDVLVIEPAALQIEIGDLVQTYTGDELEVSIVTSPPDVSVAVLYDDEDVLPVNAGAYAVIASSADANYTGSAEAELTVEPAFAAVTLTNLSHVYDGAGKQANVVTDPVGLSVITTYDGAAELPSDVGTYMVVATIDEQNFVGSSSATLIIAESSVEITLSNLARVYDGSPKAVDVVVDPDGVPVTITYDGSTEAPANAGSYAVLVESADINYGGSATGVLVIEKAEAAVSISGLEHVYDGTAKSATVGVTPAVVHSVLYNGNATPPTDAGEYTVHVVVNDSNYRGEGSAVLSIDRASASIELTGVGPVTYDGEAKTVSATTTPPDLPVAITYNGSLEVPVNAGSYNLMAVITSPNYQGTASGELVIEPAPLQFAFDDLIQTYTGDEIEATVVTTPADIAIDILYDDDDVLPLDAGTYTVTASSANPNYIGNATADLVIEKAQASIALGALMQEFNGEPRAITVATVPADLDVIVSYDGSNVAPIGPGSFVVNVAIDEQNYAGSAAETLVITDTRVMVTIQVAGSGEGTVSPEDGLFFPGASLTFTANAADGSRFSGWSGDVAGAVIDGSTISFSAATRTIIASFEHDDNPVHVVFPDAAAIGNGDFFVEWFGYINAEFWPFIYHYQHGWWYISSSSPTSIFAYDYGSGFDWIWTSPLVYGWLYDFSGVRWLYYTASTENPRWFYDPIVDEHFSMP